MTLLTLIESTPCKSLAKPPPLPLATCAQILAADDASVKNPWVQNIRQVQCPNSQNDDLMMVRLLYIWVLPRMPLREGLAWPPLRNP